MRWRTDIILVQDYDFLERGADIDMFPEHFFGVEQLRQINVKVHLMKVEKGFRYRMYFLKD